MGISPIYEIAFYILSTQGSDMLASFFISWFSFDSASSNDFTIYAAAKINEDDFKYEVVSSIFYWSMPSEICLNLEILCFEILLGKVSFNSTVI